MADIHADDDLSVPGAESLHASERNGDLSDVRPADRRQDPDGGTASVNVAAKAALDSGDEGAWLDAWHRSIQRQRALRNPVERTGTDHYE